MIKTMLRKPAAMRAAGAFLALAWQGAAHGYYLCGDTISSTRNCPNGEFPIVQMGDPYTYSKTTVDFGSVTLNTKSTAQTVTITNNATVALRFPSAVTITGSPFSGTTTCGSSLNPGASCSFSISFTPSTAGSVTGQLNITTSTGTDAIVLQGTGASATSTTSSCQSTPKFSVTTSGSITSQTITAGILAACSDSAKTGNLYVVALIPNGTIFCHYGTGWAAFTGGVCQPYALNGSASVALGAHTLPVVQDADLSAVVGTEIYVGYGVGSATTSFMNMLNSGSYAKAYTVPNTQTPQTPSQTLDSRLVGTWGMMIPGAAYVDADGYMVTSAGTTGGTLTIGSDGKCTWVTSWGTYTSQLASFQPSDLADQTKSYWGPLTDGFHADSRYYVYYEASDKTIVVKDASTNFYIYVGGRKR